MLKLDLTQFGFNTSTFQQIQTHCFPHNTNTYGNPMEFCVENKAVCTDSQRQKLDCYAKIVCKQLETVLQLLV